MKATACISRILHVQYCTTILFTMKRIYAICILPQSKESHREKINMSSLQLVSFKYEAGFLKCIVVNRIDKKNAPL